ncbi:nitroreductase family protein [Anaerotalea alkaliphila]|uniref:Nitroreductase family protein n=1 Tax=Anaerotalea alkaliphila TaxID=2662126 RepID=A0A7X5HTM9_9FIRM|nr:nitroreductase family protein [Anaerotalea alkaliphila]NDL66462.1 nitroreductase family protein [Anaerotalea alkaliphila]
MDVLQAIMTRTSIRKFTGERVGDQVLDQILRAGFAAPSAHNVQPWQFMIVDDPDTLEAIAEAHTHAKMLPSAGTAIVVCGDTTLQPELGFLLEDCSAAMQNMLLAIHGLGMGGVWIGIHPVEDLEVDMARILKLPGGMLPVGIIALGHAKEPKEPRDKYNPEKIHYNQW